MFERLRVPKKGAGYEGIKRVFEFPCRRMAGVPGNGAIDDGNREKHYDRLGAITEDVSSFLEYHRDAIFPRFSSRISARKAGPVQGATGRTPTDEKARVISDCRQIAKMRGSPSNLRRRRYFPYRHRSSRR